VGEVVAVNMVVGRIKGIAEGMDIGVPVTESPSFMVENLSGPVAQEAKNNPSKKVVTILIDFGILDLQPN
jgi:hypothetical protein